MSAYGAFETLAPPRENAGRAPIAAVRRVVRNRPGSTEAVWKLKRAPPIRNYWSDTPSAWQWWFTKRLILMLIFP